MPPKKSSAPPATAVTATGKKPVFGITRSYLFIYNFVNFALWATCTIRTASLLLEQQLKYGFLDTKDISEIPNQIFPYLLLTQSLAILEIFHSLVGIVRAPLLTTAMQVGSRIMVVVGIMYAFREGSELAQVFPAVLTQGKPGSGDGLMGIEGKTQPCDLAFLGCMFAWGITECIRYGFFVLQLGGMKVPGWWQWLRYEFPYFYLFDHLNCEANLVTIGTTPSSSSIPSVSLPNVSSCISVWDLRNNLFMSIINGLSWLLSESTSQVSCESFDNVDHDQMD